MKIDWEKIIKQKRLENIKQVYKSLDAKWLKEKITSESNRTGVPIEKFYEEIRDLNLSTIIKFAKDPNKQNIHEIIASEFIKPIDGVTNFKILPKSGKNAIYLTSDGNVLKYQPDFKSLKTIDMTWEYKNITFYASHKYTYDEGGAQDNQFEDVKRFLESVQKIINPNVFFVCLTDGLYYQKLVKNGMSRKDYLNMAYKGLSSAAISTEELADFMKKL
ncbi:hypothetical protein FJO69_02550 [[Mycoplasma] falconis]|uniref:Uncharacterized protein n=1 Tax=[Mycoplasma] falconis TaxID=92403 RepID=A0A501X8S8_9BACT|nr:hypothetical protein [[Mycoplasma] falconis]TPE56968.1 hypothetical protein FJO69_02550 [[Mycoplasma] falconis]